MESVNLIPAPRQDEKRRRKAMRRCGAACVIYALVVGIAGTVAQLTCGQNIQNVEQRLGWVNNEMRRAESANAAVRVRLAASRAAYDANRKIVMQPDWSLLLATLAQQTGDSIMLKSCGLAAKAESAGTAAPTATLPVPAKPPIAPRHPRRRIILTTAGLAESRLALSQFVLRLERTGLFARVTEADAHREAFLGSDAVAFRIDSVLEDQAK